MYTNDEDRRAYHRAWRAENKEKVKGYARRSYGKTREKKYEATKAWRKANPEKAKASTKKWRAANRARVNATQQKWLKANPDKAKLRGRNGAYKYKYGITIEGYEVMLAAQGGCCALCGKPPEKPLVVDHDHTTEEVRALLCNRCNLFIGFLEAQWPIQKAIAYLVKYKSASVAAGAGSVAEVLSETFRIGPGRTLDSVADLICAAEAL
jgi:hypothetical protein